MRHKLISGRTGGVHSKKMRSPKKNMPTGEIEVLIGPTLFKSIQDNITAPILVETIVKRRRKPLAIIEEPALIEEPLIPEIVTEVDKGIEAYGYILRAIECLSINCDLAGKRESDLLNNLLRVIDQYEKK